MNIADEKEVLKGKQLEKFKLKQEKTDLKAILETEYGRRFVWNGFLCLEYISNPRKILDHGHTSMRGADH